MHDAKRGCNAVRNVGLPKPSNCIIVNCRKFTEMTKMTDPLSKETVLQNLEEALQKATFARPPLDAKLIRQLQALTGIVDDEEPSGSGLTISLRTLYEGLFPGKKDTSRKTMHSAFSRTLNELLEQTGLDCRYTVDKSRSAPEHRSIWFEGTERLPRALEDTTERNTAPIDRSHHIKSAAISRPFRVFVSYAEANEEHVLDLLARIKTNLKARGYPENEFEFWVFNERLPKETQANSSIHKDIQAAVERSSLGICCISNEYLASDYVCTEEIPHFVPQDAANAVAPHKPAVSLLIAHTSENADYRNLRMRWVTSQDRRDYARLRGNTAKSEFADEVTGRILNHAEPAAPKDLLSPETPPDKVEPLLIRPPLDGKEVPIKGSAKLRLMESRHERNAYAQTSERLAATVARPGRDDGEAQVLAVDAIIKWANDRNGRPFMALMGEYGYGKTTACRMAAEEIRQCRSGTDDLDVVLFDLRDLVASSRKIEPDSRIGVADILRHCAQTEKGEKADLTPDRLRDMLKTGNLLVMFDGLDEVLVHLDANAGTAFIGELLSIAPRKDQTPDTKRESSSRYVGKILLSCRSHYFKTLSDEALRLYESGRKDKQAGDFEVLTLLPFSIEQIREYIDCNVDGLSTDDAISTIESIHNLTDLASRPYHLKLISERIGSLEKLRQEGRTVNAAVLYGEFVGEWLERDHGKHQIDESHKPKIMEELAAELWRRGARRVPFETIENWFDRILLKDPILLDRYGGPQSREVFKEDLRTATFITRAADKFGFAHTSVHEYFLARYLFAALTERQIEKWNLPNPSPETLNFVRQIWENADSYDCECAGLGLKKILEQDPTGTPKRTSNAFDLYADLFLAGFDIPHPTPFNLTGIDLTFRKFIGHRVRKLDMRGAILRNAQLNGSEWHNTDFSGADLEGADLTRIIFNRCDLGFSRSPTLCPGGKIRKCTTAEVSGLACLDGREHHPPSGIIPATLEGHMREVRALAVSPEGNAIWSAGFDKTVRKWNPQTGELVATLEGHTQEVRALAVSLDGDAIWSAGDDRTIRKWNPQTGELVVTLEGHTGWVQALAVSPDGNAIWSAGDDRTVRKWNAQTGELVATLEGHTGWVQALAVSPDGNAIWSAGADQTVRKWSPQTGELVATLDGHMRKVRALAISPDGNAIWSAGFDKTVRKWNAQTGELVAILGGHTGEVRALAISPEGNAIWSAGDDRTVRKWNPQTGEHVATLEGHTGWIQALAVSPDGNAIWSAGDDRSVRKWKRQTGKLVATLEGHTGWVQTLAASPDGNAIWSAGDDRSLRKWNAQTGELVATLEGHIGWVQVLAVCPDGNAIWSAGDDRTVRKWNSETGELVATLEGHTGWVQALAVSPDGNAIWSAGDDQTVRKWNPQTGELVAILKRHTGPVQALAVSPDGNAIWSAGADQTVRKWNPQTGELVATLGGHSRPVQALAVSPDGNAIWSAGNDRTVKKWNPRTAELVATLEGHAGWVQALAVSPDGNAIWSAGGDRTVRKWNPETGELVATLEGHTDWVRALAVNPDGNAIWSAGDDNTVRKWNPDTGELVIRSHLFNDGWLTVDTKKKRFSHAGGNAWKYGRYVDPNAEGFPKPVYPMEALGPVPGMD